MTSRLLGYEEAAAIVAACANSLRLLSPPAEQVDLAHALGRVLAKPIHADRDQPPFTRSTRDGFACRAAEASAHRFLHIAGATRAGDAPGGPLPADAAWEIMTGAPLPEGADAVMMIEHVEIAEGRTRLISTRTLMPGDNAVTRGAEACAGDELLPVGVTLNFAQVALAATCGCAVPEVFRKPRVAILTTGDELVPVDAAPAPGQIRNSNAPMLAALVSAAGGEPWILPSAADNDAALDAAFEQAAQADLLLISGGVSAGKFDLVKPALARIGAQVHFDGVSMQPGKPTVFGELPRRSAAASQAAGRHTLPYFGLPGNPISSAVTFLLFAAPVLSALAGSPSAGPRFADAQFEACSNSSSVLLTRSPLTRFLPAFRTFRSSAGQLPHVRLIPWQGSGDLAALARSNCFLVIREEKESPKAGEIVRILLV